MTLTVHNASDAKPLVVEPVLETLILGSSGSLGYSFVGQGRPINVVGGRR